MYILKKNIFSVISLLQAKLNVICTVTAKISFRGTRRRVKTTGLSLLKNSGRIYCCLAHINVMLWQSVTFINVHVAFESYPLTFS